MPLAPLPTHSRACAAAGTGLRCPRGLDAAPLPDAGSPRAFRDAQPSVCASVVSRLGRRVLSSCFACQVFSRVTPTGGCRRGCGCRGGRRRVCRCRALPTYLRSFTNRPSESKLTPLLPTHFTVSGPFHCVSGSQEKPGTRFPAAPPRTGSPCAGRPADARHCRSDMRGVVGCLT